MSWIYKNEEIDDVSLFPPNTYGFVYLIKHLPSGKSYIGKKILIYTRKVKLTKKDLALYEGAKGRKPSFKKQQKESDWKTYWGSNKELISLSQTEPLENFTRDIIITAPTKKLLTYYEAKYLMIYEVLEKPDLFFNNNILSKFYTIDFTL
jgi:hypothetical protein